MSRYQVKKLAANPAFKTCLKDIGDEAVANAKQVIRSKTGELANEITRVLTERLDENDLEAVKVALKVIGFDAQDNQQKGDTNIVVQLPGKPVVDVESKTIEISTNEPN